MAQSDIPDLPGQLARARQAVNAGRFEGARAICADIFTQDPGNLAALQIYMSATRIAPDDPVFARLRRYARLRGLPADQASQLQFMLGKGLDDLGLTAPAFAAFRRANALKPVRFDAQEKAGYARQLIEAAARLRLARLPAALPRLIFVLGMPRSGTSLMAQCLAAHPQVASMGEMTALGAALTDEGRLRLVDAMGGLTPERLRRARARYLAAIPEALRAGGMLLVDKMPENYWLAWAIPLLFPDAPILHMRRDRLAVCWSCYRNDFGQGHDYSYDFRNLLTQYDTQERLCAAWKAAAPGAWCDIELSQLAARPQAALAPVLDRLGLPWDPACLSPASEGKEVRTLSKYQVRRGIRPEIAEAWQAYAPLIQKQWGALIARQAPAP